MTFDVYVLNANNLLDGENTYCTVESFSTGTYFLNGKTKVISEDPRNPNFDPDERSPFRLSILRASKLRFRIYNKNKIFADTLLYEGEIPKLIDINLEDSIPVQLIGKAPTTDGTKEPKPLKEKSKPKEEKGSKEKDQKGDEKADEKIEKGEENEENGEKKEEGKEEEKPKSPTKTKKHVHKHHHHHHKDKKDKKGKKDKKDKGKEKGKNEKEKSKKEEESEKEKEKLPPPVLYVKVMPPVPYTEYADWHPSNHSIFCCLSFPKNYGYSRKPYATLELLSVNSDKKVVRPFGTSRRPEKWIKYDSDPIYLGINGPVHVLKLCTKRAPKQVFIPLVSVWRDDYECDLKVTFYIAPKAKKIAGGVRLIDETNAYPKIIQEDTIHIDSYGIYASGHILMHDPGKPPKFVAYMPRKAERSQNFIEFAKHYGPTVFKAASNWVYEADEEELSD